MHEDDDVEVRRHRRKRPGMAAGEMAAGRHDRASGQAVYPYTAASAPAIREALGEDWRGPKAQQDKWSSGARMGVARDLLCLEHLNRTCAPAGWPQRMPSRKSRL